MRYGGRIGDIVRKGALIPSLTEGGEDLCARERGPSEGRADSTEPPNTCLQVRPRSASDAGIGVGHQTCRNVESARDGSGWLRDRSCAVS